MRVRRLRRWAIAAATVMVTAVLAHASSTGVISGTVTSAINGSPLAGVTVTYGTASKLTNSNGNYRFRNVAPGSYSVTAKLSGWMTESQPVTVTAGTTSRANFKLSPPSSISGTVINSSGTTVGGATITVNGGDIPTSKAVTTSSTGAYSLSNLPVGTYSVSCQATSYASQTVQATTTANANTTENFLLTSSSSTSGSTSVTVAISPTSATLQTGATQQFTSTVTGTTNTGVTWWVNGVQGGNSTVGTITSGLYTAPAVVPSSNPVTVTAISVADSTKSGSAAVTIKAATTSSTTGTVAGVVTDFNTNQAIANASVSWSGGMVRTATDGSYSLANVTTGTITVSIAAAGYVLTSEPVSVTGGQTTTDNFALKTGPGAVVWSADMETGDLSQWTLNGSGGSYDSGDCTRPPNGVAMNVVHSGVYSMEMTIDTTIESGCRQFRNQESESGKTYYYAAWFYLPQKYTASQYWNIFQFKSKTSTTDDPFWVIDLMPRSTTGAMHLRLRWKGMVPGPYATSTTTGSQTFDQTLMDVTAGKWTHLEAFLEQSGGYTGRLTIWQDGVQLWDMVNVATRYSNGVQQWSVNNYSNGITPNPVTMYVDDATISNYRVGP